jgi:NAD(P)-dependent dehydrogenase (short-subunit alcohol dehydrogenase family)
MAFPEEPRASLRPVVVVTGCNSGIGFAVARLLREKNEFRVVATCRAHAVEELKNRLPENENFLIKELDVTSEQQREEVISEVFRKWRRIDALINNAGISYRSVVEHMDDASELKQLEVNYLGPMALIRLVFPPMREQGQGKIINVSSVSGLMAMPTMASYSASKHALEGASEALWYEAKPFGISVTILQLGFIKSKSFENVYYSKKAEISSHLEGPFADYYEHMGPFIARLMKLSRTRPEDVALRIYRLLRSKNPPLWAPATLDARLFFWWRKILPRRLFHKIMFSFLPGAHSLGGHFSKVKNNNKVRAPRLPSLKDQKSTPFS